MKTLYHVFDRALEYAPLDTFDGKEALDHFADMTARGYSALFQESDDLGDTWRDRTPEATELAAKSYLKDCDQYTDIPEWVAVSDAYDTWLVDSHRERREWQAMREQEVI